MYISKITLRKSALSLNKLSSYIAKDAYGYHQLIWNLFSENNHNKKRDFIYRSEFYNNWPNFLIVSKIYPCDQDNIWDITTKSYEPMIKNEDIFYFKLRVNPRIYPAFGIYKNKCIDIIQEALYNFRNSKRKSKSEIIQSISIDWLSKKSKKKGFTVNTKNTIVSNFEKHILNKLKQHNSISFSTIDFEGKLKVNDSEKFIQTLFNGIGAEKGFGCGLLLIKR